MEFHELTCTLEAVLFASGDSMSENKLCAVLGVDKDKLREAARELADYYDYERRGIRLLRLDDRYQLSSRADYAQQVRNALETRRPPQLSASALEVLAIVAYRQPTTKAYVEQVRGVSSDYTIASLAEKGLLEDCGRLDVPGRPILYRTTERFLRTFGLNALSQLPTLDVLSGDGPEQLTLEDTAEAVPAVEDRISAAEEMEPDCVPAGE